MAFDEFGDCDDEPEPWLDFTEDLAARLGDLEVGVFEFIDLVIPERGWRGELITYTATSSGRVRCVVPNQALAYRNRDEFTQHSSRFAEIGWSYQPRKHRHIKEVGRRRHREGAKESIVILRDWWGISYPWSLTLRDPHGSVHPLGSRARQWESRQSGRPMAPSRPEPRARRHLTVVPDLAADEAPTMTQH